MSKDFYKELKVVLDGDLTESHRFAICALLKNLNGVGYDEEQLDTAMTYTGKTTYLTISVDEEEVYDTLVDMNDCDYLYLIEK